MPDYARIAASSSRLIQKFGRAVTFIKKNETPSNASQPWKGPASGGETELELYGVFVPPSAVRQFGLPSLGFGTELENLIASSEQICITQPGETDLREYSTLLDGTLRWGILTVQVLRPADKTLLAYVGVKR